MHPKYIFFHIFIDKIYVFQVNLIRDSIFFKEIIKKKQWHCIWIWFKTTINIDIKHTYSLWMKANTFVDNMREIKIMLSILFDCILQMSTIQLISIDFYNIRSSIKGWKLNCSTFLLTIVSTCFSHILNYSHDRPHSKQVSRIDMGILSKMHKKVLKNTFSIKYFNFVNPKVFRDSQNA